MLINLGRDCPCGLRGFQLHSCDGHYFGVDHPPKEPCSVFSMGRFETSSDIKSEMKKKSKGGPHYAYRLATRRGYVMAPVYDYNEYLDDVFAIHTSKEVRCGRPMKPAYLEYPIHKSIGTAYLKCPKHNCVPFIAIKDGHAYGYISPIRSGDVLLYSMIIGHGDHLSDGIMGALHYQIATGIMENRYEWMSGVKHIIYAGHYQGQGNSLTKWKEQSLFEPQEVWVGKDQEDQ